MANEYEGAMPDNFFRVLTPDEEETFRQAARDIWSNTKPENFSVFHPVCRDEWRKLDEAHE